ncbi:MAG: hypothetical protein KAS96_02280 [Planctomycetes bacterium]|nr:hypothetical protein [Planctomycetota bacterium]
MKHLKLVEAVCLFLFIALFCSISLAIDGDINNDSKVNFDDLTIIAENWLDSCSDPSWCNGADINADNIVNMKDFALLSQNWDKDSSLVLWYQMDSNDDFTVGDGAGGSVTGRLYVDNKVTGTKFAAMTSTSGIVYDPAEEAVYMNGVNPCKIDGKENGNALFTSSTQYTFSLWAKGKKSVVQGNGYSFYLWFSDDSKFKCDLGFQATQSACFTAPGGSWLNNAYHIWDPDPAYADIYVDPETWNTYTFTWDADNNMIRTYVNGILRASYTGPSGDVPAITAGATISAFGFGDNYGWAGPGGWYKDFRIYNRALEPYEVAELCVEVPATSWGHSPADGDIAAVTPDFDLTLRWSAGKYAQSHDVYFGTSYSAVENAIHASPEYKGNLSKYITSYNLASLDPNLTYYWRIDEIGTEIIYTGLTLSFSVSDVWLYTFHNSTNDLDAQERICAYTIQGFANRDKARLFIDTKGGNQMILRTVDTYWADYLQTSKGYRFGIINNLRELVQLAKASGFVDGLVLYAPYTLDVGGEVMPALNIASTQNRLPVTADMINYTSKEIQNYGSARCFDGMNTVDIRGNWATHLDAQTDYVTNHLAGTPTDGVCKVHQNFSTFNEGANYNVSLDYGIIKGYFFMDMNPAVTSEKTLYNIVMDYLTAPAMVFGGWHNEGSDVAAISAKGNFAVLSMGSNLSFWAHVPADPANLWMRKPTSGKTLDPNKFYVMIQASDGDSMGFEVGLKPSGWNGHSIWLDPDRGTTKITWTTQPLSATLWPALTEYYVLTSTPNDTFCTGPSGAGYCQPSSFPNDAARTAFAVFEEPILQLTGIQWAEQWWGWSESLWTTMRAGAPSIKAFGHQGTSGGKNHWLDDGTPVAISDSSLWHPFLDPTNPADPYNISDPNNIVNHITAFAATRKTPYFITCYDNPPHAFLYSKQCQASLPANFEMVTVEDFIDLMDQAVHPKPWGTLLTYDDFETSFGSWTDGGTNCDRSYQVGDTYSRLGTYAIHITNTGTTSLFTITNPIDVDTPGYTQIKVTFWYVGNSMETGEYFNLEYSPDGGTTWNVIKKYTSGTDFANGVTNFRYNVVYINEGTIAPNQEFPTNMKLRFRCYASTTYDHIYIDCVTVEAQ